MSPAIERRRIVVRGTVQGVGFRPFVHRLASRHRLGGFALNDGRGVLVEAEGETGALDSFTAALAGEAPPLARVDSVAVEQLAPLGQGVFRIEASADAEGTALIPADAATCDECLRELWDPEDRRHRYPFINCTRCGPRFTIVRRPPYDRASTTMAGFEMCEACRGEYEDPADRRFHAEPIACPDCGPAAVAGPRVGRGGPGGGRRAAAAAGGSSPSRGSAATTSPATRRTRRRSRGCGGASGGTRSRSRMISAVPEELAEVGEAERRLLFSRVRPIVLLMRREPAAAGSAGAVGRAGQPLAWADAALHAAPPPALRRLRRAAGDDQRQPLGRADRHRRRRRRATRLDGIVDAVLAHDRPIHRRCEDSVVRAGFPLRRSRGLAPAPLPLRRRGTATIVAAGGRAEEHLLRAARRPGLPLPAPRRPRFPARLRGASDPTSSSISRCSGCDPEVVAHDLHPDYLSTRWAFEQDVEAVGVQHHHAHAAACLAEHGSDGPALALVLRRHRLRARRHSLGRRAAPLRPRALRARSPTWSRCRCPAARRRSASPGGWPPPTWSGPAGRSALRALGPGAPEPRR